MRAAVIILALMVSTAFTAPPPSFDGPYLTTINIAYDLTSADGACPGTPGGCTSYASRILFHPPEGYQVKLLTADANFIAAPGSGVIQPGKRVEIGWGLKWPQPDASAHVTFPGYPNPAYDNTCVWIQDYLDWQKQNLRWDGHRDLGSCPTGVLSNNILLSQVFAALDTTGLDLHMEATFTLTYEFIRI